MSEFFDDMLGRLSQHAEGQRLDVGPSLHVEKPKWLYDFCVETMGYEDMRPQPHYEL